jgi:hypothetical protein
MTQPTIPSNDGRISSYVAATASTGPFAVDFPFFSLDDVIVDLLPDGSITPHRLVRGPDYTLTATQNEDGSYTNGSVTLTVAVSLTTVTRLRDTTIERLSNFPLEGYFSRLSLNADLNRFTTALQDFQRRLVDAGGADDGSSDGTSRLDAMLQVPQGEAGSTVVLASDIATRKLRVLGWDVNGGLTQGPQFGTLLKVPDAENGVTVILAAAAGLRANRLLAWDASGNLVHDQPRGVGLQVPAGELGNGKTLVSSPANLRPKRLLVWDANANLGEWHTYDTVMAIPDGESGLYSVIAAAAATRRGKILAWDASGNLIQSVATLAQLEGLFSGATAYAPLASPVFTGNPTAPDPPPGDNDSSIPTTRWVEAAIAGAVGGSTPVGPAGGDLAGSYPNPTIKPSATNGQQLTTVAGVAAWANPPAASAVVSDTAPGSPSLNALWFNSALGQMFIWYNDGNSTQWVPVAPSAQASVPVFRQLQRTVLVAQPTFDIVGLPADINDLKVHFDLLPITNAVDLYCQFYGASGVLDATANHYVWSAWGLANTAPVNSNVTGTSSTGSGVTTGMGLSQAGTTISATAGYGIRGSFDIPNIKSASFKALMGQAWYMWSTNTGVQGTTFVGDRQIAEAITGLRLSFGSGNIASGTVTVWGSP